MSRRIRRFLISEQFLAMLFTRGATRASVVEDGLPPGSRTRGVFVDPQLLAVGILVEHESFDEVPEGALPPIMETRISVYYPPEDGVWGELTRAAEAAFPGRGDAMVREAYRLAVAAR